MKLADTVKLTVVSAMIIQFTMCGNTSNDRKVDTLPAAPVRQGVTDTSKTALQKLVDSTYPQVAEYSIGIYNQNKLSRRLDSIIQAMGTLREELGGMEMAGLSKIATAAGMKLTSSETRKEIRELYRSIFQKENDLVVLLKDSGATKESLDIAGKKSTTDKPAVEERLNKIHNALKTISGPCNLIINNISYKAFVCRSAEYEVKIHVNKTGAYSFDGYKNFLAKKPGGKVLMMTNGGMFKNGYQPQGLMVSDGKVVADADTSGTAKPGNFYLYPNGVFFVDVTGDYGIMETREYKRINAQKNKLPQYATQSGPMLVINNKIHNQFTAASSNVNIRSGVGKMSDREVVFLISEEPVNFYDFSIAFLYYFGCSDALYLDGAISKMYFPTDKSLPDGLFGPMISVIKK